MSLKDDVREEIEAYCNEYGDCNYDPDDVVLEQYTEERYPKTEYQIVRVYLDGRDDEVFEVNEEWGIIDFVPSLVDDLVFITNYYDE